MSYTFNTEKIEIILDPMQKEIYKEAIDALFTVKDNRVTAFKQSSDGETIDFTLLKRDIKNQLPEVVNSQKEREIIIEIPVKILKPKITTEKVNNLGIVEIIGEGNSHFKGSIENRIHNITLASSRLNGILVAPNETFSFNKTVGDISGGTGYKTAYVIKDGRTVLGDGGGVCQVSTTLFRAILNAGLPIVERHPHSYRVTYYEQGSPPGIDATVYSPSIDLRFKNDTNNYVLIQTYLDPTSLGLTFRLYGKKDGREVEISKPVILNQTAPPPPLYQDDPELAKGVVRQVDWAAPGANVSFSRTVKKDGKIIISETFKSNYSAWQAVFLRGTKE